MAAVVGFVVHANGDALPGEVWYIGRLQALGEPVPSVAEFVRVTTGTEGALVVLAAAAPWLVWRHQLAGAAVIGLLLATMLVVQPIIKDVVDRPRPTAAQVDVRADHSSSSYPSGHSMSTSAVWGTAVGLAHRRRRNGVAALAAIPIVVTFLASGVQGVHWPSDAVGGTLLGTAAAAVAVRVVTTGPSA